MSERLQTIVKVGGSLLERVDLPERLRSWLAAQPEGRKVLVVGGGRLVEQIRTWHASFPLDETMAHWICIDLMRVTARLLQSRLPELPLTGDYDRLRGGESGSDAMIFDSSRWLREIEPSQPGSPLPASWDATSDAIAGRLAVVSGADRLVFLKWHAPPKDAAGDLSQLAAQGYIDETLAQMGATLPEIEWLAAEKGTGVF